MRSKLLALPAAAALSTALAVALAAPAHALPVAPTARALVSTTVDAPASWERESGCDPVEKKGPRKLRKLLLRTYGPVSSNIVRRCSSADSGHEEGRAIDWMVNVRDPRQREIAESFLTWLQAPDEAGNAAVMARRLGLSYVIWNNQMWRPASDTWTTYRDCDRPKMRWKKYDSTCHRNHIHVSFSWAGALGRTSFFTGYVACPAAWSTPWVPAILPPVSGVLPVAATRVLNTRRGAGLTDGPCRVAPDVRLDVPVLGAGAVPATGVSSVVLRVKVIRPDAQAQLRVWTAGTAAPAEPALVVERRAKGIATVTVPVGQDGLASVVLSGGMAHLVADVTGYTVGAAT
jgi:hypothetical protein